MVKQIRLKDSYRGKRTQERVIAPGTYDIDDKRLFGLSDYLVENGHAVTVKADGKPAPVTTMAGGDVQFFTTVTGEPLSVLMGRNPDLTEGEVQEIINRYHLALELKARAENAVEADRRAEDVELQGEDIYHLRQRVSDALGGELLTVPGKGIVPDVVLPKAVWDMGKDVVFPVDAPRVDTSHLEELDEELENNEAHVNWVDTADYRNLQRERADAMLEAGADQDKVNADFEKRERAAESKWNEARVKKSSKPSRKTVSSK